MSCSWWWWKASTGILPAVSSLFNVYSTSDMPCSCAPKKAKKTVLTSPQQWKHRMTGVLVSHSQVHADHGPNQEVLGMVSLWKDVTWMDSQGWSGQGYVQLEFQASSDQTADGIHWIQFIRLFKYDLQGQMVENENFVVDRGLFHCRNTWFIDVPRKAKSPFYDEHAILCNRSMTSLEIFDKPCGVFDPDAHSEYVIEFETYLVHRSTVLWRIHWQLRQTKADKASIVVVYSGPDAGTLFNRQENVKGKWTVGYTHAQLRDSCHTIQMKADLWRYS